MLDPEVKQEIEQAVQQAVQAGATQTAQQIAEQVSQAVSQAVSKVMQSQTQTTGATMVAGREELGDIGGTERLEKDQMSDSGFQFLNNKLTYDMILNAAVDSIKANAKFVDNAQQEYQTHVKNMNGASHQAVQNAISNQDMVTKQYLETNAALSKQHFAHRDIATDRTWNVDEQGWQVESILRDNTFKDAVAAAVSQQVTAMIPVIVAAVGDAVKTKTA